MDETQLELLHPSKIMTQIEFLKGFELVTCQIKEEMLSIANMRKLRNRKVLVPPSKIRDYFTPSKKRKRDDKIVQQQTQSQPQPQPLAESNVNTGSNPNSHSHSQSNNEPDSEDDDDINYSNFSSSQSQPNQSQPILFSPKKRKIVSYNKDPSSCISKPLPLPMPAIPLSASTSTTTSFKNSSAQECDTTTEPRQIVVTSNLLKANHWKSFLYDYYKSKNDPIIKNESNLKSINVNANKNNTSSNKSKVQVVQDSNNNKVQTQKTLIKWQMSCDFEGKIFDGQRIIRQYLKNYCLKQTVNQ